MVDQPNIIIFDRQRIRLNRERSTARFPNHNFLFEWSKTELSERIYDINRDFPNVLQIGSRSPLMNGEHKKISQIITMDLTRKPVQNCDTYIQASEEFLPIAPKSMDMAISNLNLHSINDLPGTLIQIHKCLKDDGVFIASMLGGETLRELREIMMKVEIEMFGGASPRVFPFADKLQLSNLLQRANYSLPIVDSDIVTVTYSHVFKLLDDLRYMGEGNAIIERSKTPVGREFFLRVAQEYYNSFREDNDKVIASFEVIFMLGWTPHSSQQKPLARGSAKYSLEEALK